MAQLGKGIDLYLMDGTATGRWQVTLSNWNCNAYKIPRANLKNCNDIPELHSPGVYFLFGKDDESDRPFVYVGEGDDAFKRVLQAHNFEKDGSYWTEVVFLLTPDGSLDKAKIKYLENRFHKIVVESKRYLIKNSNTPPQSPVQKKIQDSLEQFIINTQLIMPALGHRVFEPQPSEEKDESEKLLYFSRNKGKGGKATGKIADDGFWVLKGSFIYPKKAAYLPTGVVNARKRYADSIDNQGILKCDISFGSPSYAASFVCGKNTNGLLAWKTKEGVTLKEIDGTFPEPTKKVKKEKKVKPQPESSIVSASVPEGTEVLHLASKKLVANGYVSDSQFIVLKGSQISNKIWKACSNWIKNQRVMLISSGKIANGVFTENVSFASPSTAAAVINGGNSNGQIMWKNAEGTSLKDLNKVSK